MVNSQIESPDQYISLYHSGVYAAASLPEWFAREYQKYLDPACIRVKVVSVFKKQIDFPFGLIAALFTCMTAEQWISHCQQISKNYLFSSCQESLKRESN